MSSKSSAAALLLESAFEDASDSSDSEFQLNESDQESDDDIPMEAESVHERLNRQNADEGSDDDQDYKEPAAANEGSEGHDQSEPPRYVRKQRASKLRAHDVIQESIKAKMEGLSNAEKIEEKRLAAEKSIMSGSMEGKSGGGSSSEAGEAVRLTNSLSKTSGGGGGDKISAIMNESFAGGEVAGGVSEAHVSQDEAPKLPPLKLAACSVCLRDDSHGQNELIQCDSCGVPVHEVCYGINTDLSISSNQSSASTEPWFCDPCRAGVTAPECEFCPMIGGAFKETDSGRWIHLVCALYTPGVKFDDIDKLSPVTFCHLAYSKFGAKDCLYCDEERFSKTGMTIQCDAGMCRNFFHVSCGQKQGLLCVSAEDEETSTPFFAYCKVHAEKDTVRIKRRNWLTIQKYSRNHNPLQLLDSIEQDRYRRKLNRFRLKYTEGRDKRAPPIVARDKVVRFLTGCPSAVRHLNMKAQLTGIDVDAYQSSAGVAQDYEGAAAGKKKSFMTPTFTSQFVNYFCERNEKLEKMRKDAHRLEIQGKQFEDIQELRQRQYQRLHGHLLKLERAADPLKRAAVQLWTLAFKSANVPLQLPPLLRLPPALREGRPKTQTELEQASVIEATMLKKCQVCSSLDNQHQVAECGECARYFHIYCLDPPLDKVPKKASWWSWLCEDCAADQASMPTNVPHPVKAGRAMRQKTVRRPPAVYSPTKEEEHLNELRAQQEAAHIKKSATAASATNSSASAAADSQFKKFLMIKMKVEDRERNQPPPPPPLRPTLPAHTTETNGPSRDNDVITGAGVGAAGKLPLLPNPPEKMRLRELEKQLNLVAEILSFDWSEPSQCPSWWPKHLPFSLLRSRNCSDVVWACYLRDVLRSIYAAINHVNADIYYKKPDLTADEKIKVLDDAAPPKRYILPTYLSRSIHKFTPSEVVSAFHNITNSDSPAFVPWSDPYCPQPQWWFSSLSFCDLRNGCIPPEFDGTDENWVETLRFMVQTLCELCDIIVFSPETHGEYLTNENSANQIADLSVVVDTAPKKTPKKHRSGSGGKKELANEIHAAKSVKVELANEISESKSKKIDSLSKDLNSNFENNSAMSAEQLAASIKSSHLKGIASPTTAASDQMSNTGSTTSSASKGKYGVSDSIDVIRRIANESAAAASAAAAVTAPAIVAARGEKSSPAKLSNHVPKCSSANAKDVDSSINRTPSFESTHDINDSYLIPKHYRGSPSGHHKTSLYTSVTGSPSSGHKGPSSKPSPAKLSTASSGVASPGKSSPGGGASSKRKISKYMASSALPKKSTPTAPPPPKKAKTVPEWKAPCCVCDNIGTAANSVRCDRCQHTYHFYCLDPPTESSPKVRGWAWYCATCATNI